MKEPQEYVYVRKATLSDWLDYSRETYSPANWRKYEESIETPYDEIGIFEEITDYELVGVASVFDEKLIWDEQITKMDDQELEDYLAKLNKHNYFPA